jgi:hypothetical protein
MKFLSGGSGGRQEVLPARSERLTAGPYVVSVRRDLKLRGGPGAEFPIIKSLADGTHSRIPSGRWALVDLEGDGVREGFVFAKFIAPVTS